MIESWVDEATQLASCNNITCTALQPTQFNASTKEVCLDAGGHTRYPPEARLVASPRAQAVGAGANGELFHGMVQPFVNMSLKGWIWYQGENNLPYHAGSILKQDGYACMLATLIHSWRAAWSTVPNTTAADAPFGVVMLADSTDEGWGCNVPQLHWAQTGNVGYLPNEHLPNTFVAAAHDLADPWDDSCDKGAACCADTGQPLDPSCDPATHAWLLQTPQFPGAGQPVTPSAGPTIHPRVKRQVGERLATAAWSVAYGHDDSPFVGPVLAGCALETNTRGGEISKHPMVAHPCPQPPQSPHKPPQSPHKLPQSPHKPPQSRHKPPQSRRFFERPPPHPRVLIHALCTPRERGLAVSRACRVSCVADTQLRIKFDQKLLKGDTIALRPYSMSEQASVTWVKIGAAPPQDASCARATTPTRRTRCPRDSSHASQPTARRNCPTSGVSCAFRAGATSAMTTAPLGGEMTTLGSTSTSAWTMLLAMCSPPCPRVACRPRCNTAI